MLSEVHLHGRDTLYLATYHFNRGGQKENEGRLLAVCTTTFQGAYGSLECTVSISS